MQDPAVGGTFDAASLGNVWGCLVEKVLVKSGTR